MNVNVNVKVKDDWWKVGGGRIRKADNLRTDLILILPPNRSGAS